VSPPAPAIELGEVGTTGRDGATADFHASLAREP
jgi:hypothetical protein